MKQSSYVENYAQYNELIGLGAFRNNYFLVRHGRSHANEAMIFCTTAEAEQSMPSGAGLTDTGKLQVESAAVLLTNEIGKIPSENVIIFTSPFQRTKETAEILAPKLSIANADIRVDENLRERYCGDLDRTPITKETISELKNGDERNPHNKMNHVESPLEMTKRMTTFVRTIEMTYTGKIIVIVSHLDPLIELCNAAEGLTPGKQREIMNAAVCALYPAPVISEYSVKLSQDSPVRFQYASSNSGSNAKKEEATLFRTLC